MDNAGICVTWRKQVALIGDYASDLDDAFLEIYTTDYTKVNASFAAQTRQTGSSGIAKVDTIKKFTELMAVTGLLHGSTLSFTRLLTTPPIIAIFKPDEPNFTLSDALTCAIGMATMIGSAEGHTVFSWSIPYSTIPNNVIKVFQKYAFLSNDIKAKYYETIKDRADFKNFGYILTDHGPDEIDGKQYTLTTYI